MNPPGRWWGAICVIALLSGLVGGCRSQGESITKPERPLKLRTITLALDAQANDNWPVRVELVRVRDADLVDALLDIQTDAWFDQDGRNFRQRHPDAHFDSWEVVPGTTIGPFKARRRGRLAGVLFCDTRVPSAPLRVARNGKVLVTIGDEGCEVGGGKPRKKKRRWLPSLPFLAFLPPPSRYA